MYPSFTPLRSFSHLLIVISTCITLGSFLYPDILVYGMNTIFLRIQEYGSFAIQIVLYQFLHWGILHLALNSYFLYTAWPMVEIRMSPSMYRLFFVSNTLFCAVALLLFSSWNTIGISGFAMALLAYLFMDLRSVWHPIAWQLGIMLIINIGIGFTSGISLTGHAAGALFGYIWWMVTKKWLQQLIHAR